MRPENPCKKDCPKRSGCCHANCADYKAFEQKCEKYRNQRYLQSDARYGKSPSAVRAMRIAINKTKGGRH